MYAARQHKEPTGRMFHQPEKKRTQLFRLEDNRGRKIAQETVKTLKTNVLQCVVKDDHDKKLAEKELLECLSIRNPTVYHLAELHKLYAIDNSIYGSFYERTYAVSGCFYSFWPK